MRWLLIIAMSLAAMTLAVPASADPATLLINALGGAAALGTTTVAFIKLGTGVALTLLSTAVANQRRSGAAARARGIVTESTTAGDQVSQSFILGRYATAGNLVAPLMAHGAAGLATPNAYRNYVIDVGDLPITGFEGAIIDGRFFEFDLSGGEFGITTSTEDFEDFLFARFYDGTQTAADTYLRGRHGSDPDRPWSADMVGTGVPYVVYTARIRRDPQIWQGELSIRTVAEGIALYDPRKDSSVGGSGAHRWANPATWEFTTNPAVMIYNILRGINLPDGSVYGGGHSAEDLPLAVWAAAMTAAAASNLNAGFEVRMAEDEPLSVIDELLKACSGQIVDLGGEVHVHVGEPPLPVLFISDESILRSQPQDLDPFPTQEQIFNGISATYVSPDDLWEAKNAPLRLDEVAVTADGRELIADVQFRAVYDGEQVQQLSQAYLQDNRRFRRHNIVLPPLGQLVRPLQTVAWTSARNGYDAKLFEITRRTTDPRSLATGLSLRERDPDDYDWSAETDLLPETAPATALAAAPSAPVLSFAVAPVIINGSDGAPRRPGLRLTWSGGGFAGSALAWEVRLAASEAIAATGTVADVESGEATVTEGLLAATAYAARARLVGAGKSVWTSWVAVTTDDVRLGPVDLTPDLAERIDTAFDRHDEVLGDAEGTIGDLRDRIAGWLGGIGLSPLEPITPLQPLELRIQTVLGDIGSALEPLEPLQPLDRIVAGEQAAIRTIEEAAVWAEDAAILAKIDGFGLRRRLTDAGVYTDPESGRVEIRAVDALAGRQSNVEVTVDALAGEVALKATTAYVNQAISDAVLDPSQIPLIDDLELRIAAAEIVLDGNTGSIDLLSDALTVEDGIVTMSSVTGRLDAAEGALELTVSQSEFGELEARATDVEIVLNALDTPGITFAVSAVGQFRDRSGLDDDARVLDMIQSWRGDQEVREATASGRRSITALVETERSVRAQEVLELQAQTATNAAAVTSEATARASADSALASDITTLQAQTAANAAAVTSEASARADADSALASNITTLQAETAANAAAVTSEASARADADGVLASDITALNAQTAANAAAVTSEATARANADSALASDITTLQAQTAANAAAVTSEATARANADSALASDITTLQAQTVANAAAVTSEATARANADSALASDITTLQAQTVANAAAVTSEATARANADSALASDITTLQANLSDLDGDVVANASGLSALGGRVDTTEDGITALAGRADVIEAGLGSANLVPNGRLDTADFRGWSALAGTFSLGVRGAGPAVMNASPTPYAVAIAADSLQRSAVASDVAVAEGDVLRLSVRSARIASGTANLRVQVVWRDAAENSLGVTARAFVPTSSWAAIILAPVTAPAGAARASVRLLRDAGGSGLAFVTDLRAERDGAGLVDVAARVATIEGAYVDENGALAFVEQQISADYGSLSALAESAAFAEATLDGISEGFVWSLGGSDVLSLVRVDDGETEPVTTARIKGDYIRLDGDVEVTGSFVVSGANVVLDADTQVNGSFEVTGPMIADGAVSGAKFFELQAPVFLDTADYIVIASSSTVVGATVPLRNIASGPDNPIEISLSMAMRPQTNAAQIVRVEIDVREIVGGVTIDSTLIVGAPGENDGMSLYLPPGLSGERMDFSRVRTIRAAAPADPQPLLNRPEDWSSLNIRAVADVVGGGIGDVIIDWVQLTVRQVNK